MHSLTNIFRGGVAAIASLVVFSTALFAILFMGFHEYQPPFWFWLVLVGGFGAVVSTA